MCSDLVLAIDSGFRDLNPEFACRTEDSTKGSREIYMTCSPVPVGLSTASMALWILNVFTGPNSGTGELKVFSAFYEALTSFFLAGHRCYSSGCFPEHTQTVSHMGSMSHCSRLTYQVTCGGGEARTVHASFTSILSQTACTLRGIQNIGGRPERSSMYSFSTRAFSTAYDKDRLHKGNRKGLCSNYTNSFTKGMCVIMLQ